MDLETLKKRSGREFSAENLRGRLTGQRDAARNESITAVKA